MRGIYFRLTMPLPPAKERQRLLERLLAAAAPAVEVADWRGSALCLAHAAGSLANELFAADLRLGSLETAGADVANRAAWVFLASAVHTRASMTSVHMAWDGVLELDAVVAARLTAEFNAMFAGNGWTLSCGRSGRLYFSFPRRLEVRTFDPALAAGQDIQPWLPQGDDAKLLRALGCEVEMWLFTHRHNAARKARELPPITTLWPWAGGPPAVSPHGVKIRLEGADPLLAACITDAVDPDLEVHAEWRWPDRLATAAKAVRAGSAFIVLSCGSIEYTVRRFPRLAPWRRLRPWWDYF